MLSEAILTLYRRKLRSILSALGMAAGVFAMELIGSISQNFTTTARHFEHDFMQRIFVCEKVSFWAGGGILSEAKLDEVRRIQGVGSAIPALIGRLESDRMLVVGVPEVVIGVPPQSALRVLPEAELDRGTWLQNDDTHGVVLGSTLAASLHAEPRKQISLLKTPFEVRGVLRATGTFVDKQALAPLSTLQVLMHREGLITDVIVDPVPGVSTEAIGQEIGRRVHGVEVITPARLSDEIRRSVQMWDVLARVLAFAAALAGGSTIAVAMVLSVHHRRAEIGIRRAIGASQGQIFGHILSEALILAALGWLLGSASALTFVHLAGPALAAIGTSLFDLAPTVLEQSLIGVLILAVVAGTGPAWLAARQDPIAAIRHA